MTEQKKIIRIKMLKNMMDNNRGKVRNRRDIRRDIIGVRLKKTLTEKNEIAGV